MRFVFVALAAAVAALAQPTARDTSQFNPDVIPKAIEDAPAAAPAENASTNAKRFAMGMPPLKPRVRRHRGGHDAPTRVRSAPRAETSPLPPVNQQCNILASLSDGTAIGFVSPIWNEFGEYSSVQGDQTGSLLVSFAYSEDKPSQLDFIAANGPHNDKYPYFGAISGFGSSDNNFGSGSYNYAYLGGTLQSPPGSPAEAKDNSFTETSGDQEDTESAVWIFDPVTMAITVQWINDDDSAPATSIARTQGVFIITGDVDSVANTFGPTDTITFTCVPPVAAAP